MPNFDWSSAAAKLKKHFERLDSLLLNIAVTGESGSGKSTFINALRGVGDEDGEFEKTMDPDPYPHPKNRNFKLWDLPGIGTPSFKADEYLKKVEFQRYDFFIIIASERFKANEMLLANEIQRTDKKFYFVRSKIDRDLDSAKRRSDFNMDETLALIKKDCITGLQENGVASPTVFLISSNDLQLYDFPKLQETMEGSLPVLKQRMLLLSLQNLNWEVIQRKKEALKAEIGNVAILSAATPDNSFLIESLLKDLGLLVKELTRYYEAFDLDDTSLQSLSGKTKVPLRELKAVLKSPLHMGITGDVVDKLLRKFFQKGRSASGFFMGPTPYLGATAKIDSYHTARIMLETCLDELAEDALNVLKRAFPSATYPASAVTSPASTDQASEGGGICLIA